MRRNFANPGRVDLAAMTPSPASRFVEGKARIWATCFLGLVFVAGGVGVLAGVFQIAAHVSLQRLAHGG